MSDQFDGLVGLKMGLLLALDAEMQQDNTQTQAESRSLFSRLLALTIRVKGWGAAQRRTLSDREAWDEMECWRDYFERLEAAGVRG